MDRGNLDIDIQDLLVALLYHPRADTFESLVDELILALSKCEVDQDSPHVNRKWIKLSPYYLTPLILNMVSLFLPQLLLSPPLGLRTCYPWLSRTTLSHMLLKS